MLLKNIFANIIKNAPLISIDLIVKQNGLILLGERLNRPAQGFWFVPGGRIYKDERLDEALKRISFSELGKALTFGECKFRGIYEHHYDDNVFGDEHSTHYVVLGFEVILEEPLPELPQMQHSCYRFFKIDELLMNPEVHQNTKDYFNNEKGIR
ncbi:GDP-mannose mannosyl hydrolase [Sulfurimonas sp. ST-25]|uniref:GDP-mannose mannosyl hydrolase n=1 Tax=Sulfurimonas sp. ST-25 TaxID=3400151 RepID=UPI003A8B3147